MSLPTIIIIIACVLLSFARAKANLDEKCCGFDQVLVGFPNATHACQPDQTKRWQVLGSASGTGFLSLNSDGSCLEAVGQGIFSCTVSAGEIVAKSPLASKFFPKCCPLGYVYNSQLHSCTEKHSFRRDFITENAIKVGLPQCKIIVDHLLDQLDGLEFSKNSDFCVDEEMSGKFVRRECRSDAEICGGMRCVRKCCPDGQSFVNGSRCVDTYRYGVDLRFSRNVVEPTGTFAVISNRTCRRIFLMSEQRYTFTLMENGNFKYYENLTDTFIEENVAASNYCIEHSSRPSAQGFFFFKCYPETVFEDKFLYTFWPKVLSCIFLALTVFIYFFLNETRNLFGKILMNYCISTLLLFSLLTHAQVDLKPTDSLCKWTGYGLIFFSTVSYAWLSVMCCDIWLTFGSTKHSIGIYQRRKDLKRLLGYMCYGWGMPGLLTLFIFLFASTEFLPYTIQPFVGTRSCFIESRKNNYAALLFLRLPHLITQIINTVLFFKTIIYCLRIKNEINRINDTTRNEKKYRFKKDQERMFLILKLSVIMGINFIFDTLTSFVRMSELGTVAKYLEIFWDCVNSLQGLFIFIIFICKRKIYNDFLRKLNIRRPDHSLNNTQTLSISSGARLSMKNGRNSVK